LTLFAKLELEHFKENTTYKIFKNCNAFNCGLKWKIMQRNLKIIEASKNT
jgi:hypothetical protein